MLTAYLCILIVAMLPYVWAMLAKANGESFDNHDPRNWLSKQTNPRVHRANSAQLNAFEAFAPFAAAVLMAQASGIDSSHIAWLAVAFVVFRVLHGLFYIADQALLRSAVWFLGLACVITLMVQSLLQFNRIA